MTKEELYMTIAKNYIRGFITAKEFEEHVQQVKEENK